jgi:CheY-like chemotaxis protein
MTAAAPMVFVVDDDPAVRKSLTRLIASAGYAVEAFASAREFLARERYPGPCCVVLDVRMPGLTGLDLQEALAGAGRRMSIVFVTGHGNISMSVKAMKGGAVDFPSTGIAPRTPPPSRSQSTRTTHTRWRSLSWVRFDVGDPDRKRQHPPRGFWILRQSIRARESQSS